MRDVFVGLCLAVGALGGWVTAGSVKDWYPTLHKPLFNPPNWLFGPVWTVLYAMMGVAAWRVWCKAWGDRARRPLTMFALQGNRRKENLLVTAREPARGRRARKRWPCG